MFFDYTTMADKKSTIETVTSLVTNKDISIWRKIYNALFVESFDDVKESVIRYIFIPRIRDAFFESVSGFFEQSMYGLNNGYSSRYGSPRSQGRTGSKASWEPYYKRSQVSEVNDQLYEPVLLDTRAKAEKVHYILLDQIARNGKATVNDLNSCVIDKDGNSRIGKITDPDWGWKSLPEKPYVKPMGPGLYQLILPEPVEISSKEKKYYEV